MILRELMAKRANLVGTYELQDRTTSRVEYHVTDDCQFSAVTAYGFFG